ncbi:thiamine-phosphate kinase [Rickettsiales bacterium LUAb2]
MNETDLIKLYLKPLVKNNIASLNLEDDVAFIQKTSGNLLITTDTIVEGVHFFSDDHPASIAHKLISVNLSDLASKGATPKYFTLNFSPKTINSLDKAWLDEFFKTIDNLQNTYKIELIGGDTTTTNSAMVISVTMIGETSKKSKLPFRFNAKSNDLVFCTGFIGDAYLGYNILAYKKGIIAKPVWLDILNNEEIEYLTKKYYFPTARVELGKMVAEISTACADISDGLVKDLYNICNPSNLTAKIKLEKQMFSSIALKIIDNLPSIISDIISGGDDYELIFTMNAKNHSIIEKLKSSIGVNITFLGNVTSNLNNISDNQLISIVDINGKKIDCSVQLGFTHK